MKPTWWMGGDPYALHLFYNVRWNETINAIEVDEGGNGSSGLKQCLDRTPRVLSLHRATPPGSWATHLGYGSGYNECP